MTIEAASYAAAMPEPRDVRPDWPAGIAHQQPPWPERGLLPDVHRFLRSRPALVNRTAVDVLRSALARAAAGEALVLQAGDCAERMTDTGRDVVSRKAGLLRALTEIMRRNTGRPVITVGRIGGQFAKPRSSTTEIVDGHELPVYRGELVNQPQPTPSARRADPARLLDGYLAARHITEALGDPVAPRAGDANPDAIWTSHEALVLDYEVPFLRRWEDRTYLGSTHWPWVGERTRRPDSAHVELLSRVVNPVACKVGPTATAAELVALCARLNPGREQGRLTFISRVGARRVHERLPALVRAVELEGYPVIWMCDPMHGNTRQRAADGRKLRLVTDVSLEIDRFTEAVTSAGGVPGGLHLETTTDPVLECADADETEPLRGTSLCDPRLNERQARAVVSRWRP
jgi:3-deoxy-7-phosphoheptulonate synthase